VDQFDSLAYFPEDREAGSILPCTGKPRSNLKIRTHQQSQMRQFRNSMDFRRATAGAKNKISNA
jgi:ferredoxin